MSKLLRAAKRKGADAVKFQYDIDIHVVEGTKATENVYVQWVRGAKIAETRPVAVENTFARFEQRMSMLCTLYRDPKKGTYGSKPTKFTVKEARAKKGHRTIGQAAVDLCTYANGENPKTEILLLKGAAGTVLRVTISCNEVTTQLVGRGSVMSMMTDDDMTDISGIDDLSQMGDDYSEMGDVTPNERQELTEALQRSQWDNETLSKELASANREIAALKTQQVEDAAGDANRSMSSQDGGEADPEEISKLKADLRDAKDKIEAAEVERDTAVATVASLTTELKSQAVIASKADEYEGKYQEEHEARLEAEDKIHNLEMALEDAGASGPSTAQAEKIASLETELAAAVAARDEQANSYDELEIDLKTARRDLGAADAKYSKLESEHEKLLADLDPEETKQLRHKLEVAEEEKKILLEKQSELERTLREAEASTSELREQVESLQTELSAAGNSSGVDAGSAALGAAAGAAAVAAAGESESVEMSKLRHSLMTAHEEIADLKDNERQAQNELDQLRSENNKNLDLVESLGTQLKDKQDEHNTLEEEVKQLRAVAANQEESRGAYDEEVNDELTALRAKAAILQEELESAQQESEEMETALNSAIEENQALETKVDAMTKAAADASNTQLSADGEAALRADLAESQAENVKLKAVHDAALSRLDKYTKTKRAEVQELNERIETLERDLKIQNAGGKASEPPSSSDGINVELDEILGQLVDAKMRLAETEARNGNLQHQLHKSGAGKQALLQQNEDLSAALVQSKLALAQAQNEVANLDSENKRNKRHYEKVKETNTFLGRRQTSIEVKLVKAEQANAELTAANSALTEEVDALKEQVKGAIADKGEAEARLNRAEGGDA